MQKNTLGLIIPAQTNSKPTVDLSLTAIEKWRSELQTADLGETARNVFSMLKSMNDTVIEPSSRFALLELIRPLSQVIYQSLKKHYINQTEPLSEQKLAILDLSRTLQTEILNGYKIIIEDINMSSNSSLKTSILPNAIYRAFKHFNNILASYYQAYTECPENMWKEMHIIYKFALACKIAETTITLDINEQKNKIEAITPYKHALFIASTSPYQWRQQEQDILAIHAILWDQYISIRNFKASDTNSNDLYFIPLNEDLPPFAANIQKNIVTESGSTLDLSKLTDYLKTYIKQPTAVNPKESAIAIYSLQKLINYLLTGTKRQLERFNIMGQVSVTFGFPSTHYYINKKKNFKPESIGTNEADGIGGEEIQLGSGLDDPSESDKTYKPDSALYVCKLINIHGEGAGIAFQDHCFPPIQPGEIVAMAITLGEQSDLDETHWNIGTIRWLRHNRENKLLAGIEIMAPFAMAAAIQLMKEDKTIGYFQRAFLFQNNNANKVEFNVVTPIMQFETGKKVKIHSFYHNKAVETSLKEQLSINNNFKLFAINIDLPPNSATTKKSEDKKDININTDPSNKLWKEL